MAKPSKVASKVCALLRDCGDDFAPIELYCMQAVLKEECQARAWLLDLLSATERAVVVSGDHKRR